MNREPNLVAPWKRRLLTALVIVAALVGIAGIAVSAPPAGSEKIMRQVRIMEGIIDKVLIDSPNFLVHSGGNTHGLYLQEYGAIFTFEASLTSGMFNFKNLNINIPQFEIKTNENGDKTIIMKDIEKSKKDKEEAEEMLAQAEKEKNKSSQPSPPEPPGAPKLPDSKDEEDSATLYQRGKAELIQAVLDYGETLTQLKSGQWIAIAAFLQNDSFFEKNKLSRLVVKAKIDDIRGFSEGSIDEKTMREKIVVEEY